MAEEDPSHFHCSIQNDSVRIVHASTSVSLTSTQPCFPMRYLLSLLTFLGLFLAQANRSAFNIALVAMVNFTASELPGYNQSEGCPDNLANHTSPLEQEGEFPWDDTIQSQLLSGFFYGYVVTQLPGGNIADRFGGGRILGFAVLLSGVVMMLLPTLAYWDYRALMAGRIIMGLLQGPTYPSVLAFWSKWAPEFERTRLNSVSSAGGVAGILIALGTTGYMCESSFLGGWPLPFYLFGGGSILWAIVWFAIASDTPIKSRCISHAELFYIEQNTNYLDQVEYQPPPWPKVFTSVPMISLAFFLLCDGFGYYVMFSTLPIYLKQVLRFDISQDGLFLAVPFLTCFIVCLMVGPLADKVIEKWPHSKTTIRKVFTFVGDGSTALAMLLIGFSNCNYVLVIALLATGYGLNGAMVGGVNIIILDMAPQYSGTLCALINLINNMGGILSPTIVAAITGNQADRTRWQLVFFITAGTYAVGLLQFMFLGSARLQPWAEIKVITDEFDRENLSVNDEDYEQRSADCEPLIS